MGYMSAEVLQDIHWTFKLKPESLRFKSRSPFVWGLQFRVSDLAFRAQGLGFRVPNHGTPYGPLVEVTVNCGLSGT